MDEVDVVSQISRYFFAALVGVGTGIGTYRYCQNRGRDITAVVGFVSCLIAGIFAGLIGACPVALVFILFAKLTSSDHQSDNRDSRFAKSMGCVTAVVSILVLVIILCAAIVLGVSYTEGKKVSKSDAGILDVIKAGWEKLPGADASQATPNAYRTFRSKDGRELEGRLVAVVGENVEIVRKDGKVFTTQIGIYSEADQEYIRSWKPE